MLKNKLNIASRNLLTLSDNELPSHPMTTSKRRPRKAGELAPGEIKITFVASPEDQQIISTEQAKRGIRKKSEVIRMALRALVESSELRAS